MPAARARVVALYILRLGFTLREHPDPLRAHLRAMLAPGERRAFY